MKTVLMLNVPPELEEDVVDCLLEQAHAAGFSSWPVASRGQEAFADMSVAEQVSGRRKQLRFEVILEESDVGALLATLAQVGSGISYWRLALQDSGTL